MRTRRDAYLLIPILLVLTSSSLAKTLYVGTCHKGSYATISAAVSAAAPGSVVDVCPGTYPEQVFIMQPLTLQGITAGNHDRARIVVPANAAGGPTNWQFVPDPDYVNQVAPQIFVNSPAGSVTVDNLTIDGSGEVGAPASCPVTTSTDWLTIGVFFENTSGTINEVNTIGQGKNKGCGVGIRATSTMPVAPTVTISNNSLQEASIYGMYLDGFTAGASLNVSVTNNSLVVGSVNYGSFAIVYGGITGTISSNYIQAQGHGTSDGGASGPLTFSGNTFVSTNGKIGFGGLFGSDTILPGVETYSGNTIVDYNVGLAVPGGASVVTNNNVVNSYLAIELGCNPSATITGNTINNAKIGIDTIPAGFSPSGKVSFFNVDKMKGTTSCP
jgi:hypothetical protein